MLLPMLLFALPGALAPNAATAQEAARAAASAEAVRGEWLPMAGRSVDALQLIDSVLIAEGADDHFPEGVPQRRVSLPDDWSRSRPGWSGPVWYRAEFTLASAPPPVLLGVQLARACASLELQLNGQLLYQSGPMAEPYVLDCDRPRLLALPPAMLHAGTNRIDLRLAGPPREKLGSHQRAAALSALTIGPLDALQSRQHLQTLLQHTLPQALAASLLLTGGFMFVLGFLNRGESHLAYFGALSVAWALLDARLWIREWPLPHRASELLLLAPLPVAAWAAVQFLLRYSGWRHRAVDIALPAQTLLMLLSLLLVPMRHFHLLVLAWSMLLALEVVTAAAHYLRRQRRERSLSFWLMGGLLAVVAAAAVIELAAHFASVPALPAQLAQLALPLMLVLTGLRLVQQQGLARQEAEISRAQLEQRVREATAEIERNFRQLSELKVEQVTERERKRIAADLHDDLGAKLLTIVHTSENDRISTLAREALEEMRLSVRGLTGRAMRLGDAMGDWRAEVVSRLAQAGIETDWSAPEELPYTLSARAYVQTTRILREATSNIIKHSGASFCSIQCRVRDGDFRLIVHDNGEGITSEPDGRLDRGHGMATMKQRAKQLQGQCLIESGPGLGTVIRLTLPLERALETS